MKVLWYVLLVFYVSRASAQTRETGSENNTQPIYNDVSGSPFLLTDWSDGVIRFNSGRVTNQFKIKFDCEKNQLLLQFNGSTFATESKVKEFVIYVKSGKGKDSMVFRKGFPAFEKGNEETFYQVLVEGKTILLCLHIKYILQEEQFASKVIYRRIRDENVFCLLKEGAMIQLPADRTIIPEKLYDQSDKIRNFISEQQLKFRNEEDYKKLVVYYNSLL